MNSPRKLRAYLSGGMEFAKGEGVDWRREMESWITASLGHTVYNPNVESEAFLAREYPNGRFRDLKKDNIGRYVELVRCLIDLDIQEIAQSTDYVVCNWDESAQRGAGTKGELTIARFTGKPVYLVTQMRLADIPGWVLGCATRTYESFDALRQSLFEMYGMGEKTRD